MASSASTSNVKDGLHIATTPSGVTSAAASIHDRISGQVVSSPAFERTALMGQPGSGTPQYSGSDNGSAKLITSKNTKSTNYAKLKYYIPALAWIPNYSASLLGGDVLAGLTVSCMLIPQSVSYASSLAKMSPVVGLFSAAVPGIVYALLGSSRQLNVAPEASLSLLVGQAITSALHDHPHAPQPENEEQVKLAVATMITLQAGLFSFLLGFFRLGFIDVVLSRALLQGFISAVAVVIMVEQLIPMFGLVALEHSLKLHTTLDKILFLVEHVWSSAHGPTTFVSFVALTVLLVLRTVKQAGKRWWWIYRLPEVLVVVVVSTILSEQFAWDDDGIDILGDVPINTHGGSLFHIPFRHDNLQYVRSTTSTAIVISIIGFLDSIVSAKQNGARFGHSISPNRELVALGAGNLVGSFIPGTLPAYGSITRSRINGDVGGRTQMASLVCSTIILLAIFVLLPYLYFLPKCVLASVICLVAFSLLAEAPHDLIFYHKLRAKKEVGLMLTTFFLSIVWDLEIGIVVSIIISLVLVVRRSARTRMTILGRIPGTERWVSINENPEAEEDVPGVLIVRIRENLDFANTAQLKERLRRLELYGVDPSHPSEEPRRREASTLVFHMADVETCDASAVQIFYEILETYKTRAAEVFITHLRPGPRAMFARAGVLALLPPGAVQADVAGAMAMVGMTVER